MRSSNCGVMFKSRYHGLIIFVVKCEDSSLVCEKWIESDDFTHKFEYYLQYFLNEV